MRSLNKLILSIILISSFYTFLKGQSFRWQAGLNGFFDNREYQTPYAESQTMFGTRMFGYANLKLNREIDIGTGLDMLYEFGDELRKNNLKPVLYLHFNKEFVDFIFGSFPRRNLIVPPRMLLSDTIQYYRPNCEGLYLKLNQSWGFQSVWLDWTSRQGDTIREVFQIGGTGMAWKGVLYYRHDFIMTHYAKPSNQMLNTTIRDNGGLYAGVGVNLSPYLFDSLTISTGLCFSYDRIRDVTDLTYSHGSLTNLYIEVFHIGIRTSTYVGTGQVLMWGDRLYRAKYYNRLDLIWYFFRKKNITGSVEFSIHVVEDILDVSQILKIHATIGDEYKIRLRQTN